MIHFWNIIVRFTGKWSYRLDGGDIGFFYDCIHKPVYYLAIRFVRPVELSFRRNV